MPSSTTHFTQTLSSSEKADIIQLWNIEYPAQLSYKAAEEFDRYLAKLGQPAHILIKVESGQVIGWLVDFWREDAKWFAMIVSSQFQKKGLGSRLLSLAKERNPELNGWATDHNNYRKANGEIYYSPLTFYQKNGFRILNHIRFENDILSSVKIQWNIN